MRGKQLLRLPPQNTAAKRSLIHYYFSSCLRLYLLGYTVYLLENSEIPYELLVNKRPAHKIALPLATLTNESRKS